MKKYKITINRKDCIGCGSCASIVPKLLSLDPSDNLVHLKDSAPEGDTWVGEIDEADLAEFLLAAEACPLGVIKIEK